MADPSAGTGLDLGYFDRILAFGWVINGFVFLRNRRLEAASKEKMGSFRKTVFLRTERQAEGAEQVFCAIISSFGAFCFLSSRARQSRGFYLIT